MLQTTRGAKYRYIVFVNCVCTFLFYDMCEMCRQRYAGMTFIDSIGAGVHMGAVYCVELFSYDPLFVHNDSKPASVYFGHPEKCPEGDITLRCQTT